MASFDFLVPVDRASGTPLRDQLYRLVREAILDARLPARSRLPSTRLVAHQTGVARQTVVEAYDQLIAEGYAVPRPASGTYVADTLPDELLQARPRQKPAGVVGDGPRGPSQRGARLAALPAGASPPTAVPVPFQTGTPALDAFPADLWARLLADTLRNRPLELLSYADAAGYRPLREAIAAYINTVRAGRCTADQVIVTGGTQPALHLVSQLLLDPGDRVWVEEPGYLGARSALLASDARPVPVPVDDQGLDVAAGIAVSSKARLAIVTPSHQYPLGSVMSLPRRRALLDWARRAGAWIVEDDYDSEYRYTGRPLASLQGLDTDGRVVYLGTFSKVLFPSLRLGYAIVPPSLIETFERARSMIDRQNPTIDQAALAGFIADGHLSRHIRRMRSLYAARQTTLLDLAHRHLNGLLELEPTDAGMHVVGWLPDGVDDRAVAQRARDAGMDLAPLSVHYLETPRRPGLLLGFAPFDEAQLADGAVRLAAVVRSVMSPAA